VSHYRPEGEASRPATNEEHDIGSLSASVAIIVVNYGSADLLAVNLVSTAKDSPATTIVVVDNFSSTAQLTLAAEVCDSNGWHLVPLATNEGFGGGMNAGVARAIELGADQFLLLNPDAAIPAPSLAALSDRVAADPMLMVAPVILRPDGELWSSGSDLYLADGRIRASRRRGGTPEDQVMTWLSGACLLISKTLWQKIGGFDEHYFLYWEDVDLSWKVHEAGGTLAVVSSATATHAEGGTQATGTHRHTGERKSNGYYYYNIRNRAVFAALRMPAASATDWRRIRRTVAWEILLQGGRRQFLRTLAPFWSAYRGLRDGARLAKTLTAARGEED
jgi:GT2 family glycosyltransferase